MGSRHIDPTGSEVALDIGADAVQPAAQVYATSNTNLTSGQFVAVNFHAADVNVDNIYSASSPTRLTCRTAGKYLIWANIQTTTGSAGTSYDCAVKKSGSTWLTEITGGMLLGAGYYSAHAPMVVAELAVGDYIEVYVYCNTASNAVYAAGWGGTNRGATFGMARIGPSLIAYTGASGGGPAVVATTVTGLGTGVNGKIGLIRAGSTAFDFVTVVYDSTYAKWVNTNPEVHIVYGYQEANPVTTTGGAGSAYSRWVSSSGEYRFVNEPGPLPWRVYEDAGLAQQVRLVYRARQTSTSGDGHVRLTYLSGDTGGDIGSETTVFTNTAVTQNAIKLYDSGWMALPGGYTVKDWIGFRPKSSSATGGVPLENYEATLYRRWVG